MTAKQAPDLMVMLDQLYGIRNDLENAGMPTKPGNCDAEAWVTAQLTTAYTSVKNAIEAFEAHFEEHPYDWKSASHGD